MRIVDKKGTWVRNAGEYPLPDYGRQTANPGSELVQLMPGEDTKIIVSEYLASQPNLRHLRETEDGDFVEIAPEPEPEAGAPAGTEVGSTSAKPVVDTSKKK